MWINCLHNGASRTYTREFGQHMANLMPAFNSAPSAVPASSYDEDEVIAKLAALSMGEDDWADAGLPELVRYVYGAKGLKIPTKWHCCFPRAHFS